MNIRLCAVPFLIFFSSEAVLAQNSKALQQLTTNQLSAVREKSIRLPAPQADRRSLIVTNQTIQNDIGELLGYRQVITVGGTETSRHTTNGRPGITQQNIYEETSSYSNSGVCAATAHVKVVGAEITYGANGPVVPTRLDYEQVTSSIITPLFDEQDIDVCHTEDPDEECSQQEISLTPGEEIRFIGKSAYPTFDAPFLNYEVASDDLVYAAILVNGDNYFTIAAQKGIQDPFGSQQSLQQILGSEVINPSTGQVTLEENVAIILYELGTASLNSPAFDFNDLVVKITTSCENGSEILIRDSIGSTSATTNGNFPIVSTRDGVSFYHIPIKIAAQETLSLKTFKGIAGQLSSNLNFNNFDYILKVWDSQSALSQNPNIGNILNITVDQPTAGPAPYGILGSQFFGERPSYEIQFDLTSLNIVIPAGATYYFAVEFKSLSGAPTSGVLGWVESTEAGESDIAYWHGGPPMAVIDISTSLHSGRLGFALTGETVP